MGAVEKEKKHRIFAAIPIPQNFLDSLARHLQPFRKLPVRFGLIENWHLTVAFFGYISGEEIRELKTIINSLSKTLRIFVLTSTSIDFAPSKTIKRMLWLNFAPSKDFEDLTFKLEKEILTAKKDKKIFLEFKPLRRPLQLHLTLSRFSPPQFSAIQKEFTKLHLEKLSAFEKDLPADRIEIIESKLSSGGAKYQTIAQYQLKNQK